MEILIAVLVIAVIAAVVFALMQRRTAARTEAGGSRRSRTSPIGRRRGGSDDPTAAAVASPAQTMDPRDVAEEELRLRAQANRVAAGPHHANANAMGGAVDLSDGQAEAHRIAAAAHLRAADNLAHGDAYDGSPGNGNGADGYADPAIDPRYDGANGYADPAIDPRYADNPGAYGDVDPATDPRYADAGTERELHPAGDHRSAGDRRYDDERQGDYVDPRYDDRMR